MKVRDVMSRNVVRVWPDTALKEVARLMVERGISGVPVVDEAGGVLGVVSEADFVIKERGLEAVRRRPLARLFGESDQTRAELAKIGAATAGDAMTAPAITIEADRPLREAAETMVERQVNRLPVVEDGRLVGIVTHADLVRAYMRPDEELERVVRDDVLLRSMWIDPAEVEVTVRDGVVRMVGTLDRRSSAEILATLVAEIEGVVAVASELRWRLDDRTEPPPDPRSMTPRSLQSP